MFFRKSNSVHIGKCSPAVRSNLFAPRSLWMVEVPASQKVFPLPSGLESTGCAFRKVFSDSRPEKGAHCPSLGCASAPASSFFRSITLFFFGRYRFRWPAETGSQLP